MSRVNYAKSGLVPLNMTSERAELMTGIFGCKMQEMLVMHKAPCSLEKMHKAQEERWIGDNQP
jgi:hypothetical protein